MKQNIYWKLLIGWSAIIGIPIFIRLVTAVYGIMRETDTATVIGHSIGVNIALALVFAVWFIPAAILFFLAMAARAKV